MTQKLQYDKIMENVRSLKTIETIKNGRKVRDRSTNAENLNPSCKWILTILRSKQVFKIEIPENSNVSAVNFGKANLFP